MERYCNIICENAEAYGWDSVTDIDLLSVVTGDRRSAEVLLDYLADNKKPTVDGLLGLGIKNMGRVKAMRVKAMCEFMSKPHGRQVGAVRDSRGLYDAVRPHISNLSHEEVWCVLTDKGGKVLKTFRHTIGGMDSSIVDVRLVVRAALECDRCACVAMAHNHPSGRLAPSGADKMVAERMRDACELVDLKFLDSIIVGDNAYHSMSDSGEM